MVGVLGSLRKRVAREVREQGKSNAALRSARAPVGIRVLQASFGERGLLGFLILYAAFAVSFVVLEIVVLRVSPSIIPSWANAQYMRPFLKDLTSYFLGAQVVMIGLLFPIAVGLVTLIVQREDASSTVSDVQVYYSESLAYRIGASGIALSIVLATQLLWPAQLAVYRFGFATSMGGSKIFLTFLHLLWLILNFAALWHFLFTSLSFMRPTERALLRRRFAANVSIPQDLSDRLMRALYFNAGSSLLPESGASDGDDGAPSLLFGSSLYDFGEVEIADPRLSGKVLQDVWMRPLGWAIRHWWKRCAKRESNSRQSGSSPTLVFVPDLRRPPPEGGIICRRRRGVPMNTFERFVVKQCFRFGRSRK